MYIQTNEGLGNDIEKDGHIRQEWSECKWEGTHQRTCDITFRVKFRRTFKDFRLEVEKAFARWMTEERARFLIQKWEEKLKNWHQAISNNNYPEQAPVCLSGEIIYITRQGEWGVFDILLQSYMTFSASLIKSGATRCPAHVTRRSH